MTQTDTPAPTLLEGQTGLTGDDLLRLEAQYPDRLFELVDGRLEERPVPGLEHTSIENLVAFFLTLYNREKKLGIVMTGEVGFYTQGDRQTVRMADIAFLSYARMPAEAKVVGCGTIAPELVVEIISPGSDADQIETTIHEWLTFGVQMVWVVYPRTQRVYVYNSLQNATILSADDILDGGTVLPGFSVRVGELFS